jgi:putative pyruvate formate lyase activating enzyme
MTASELARVMLELQTRGCHNINLVSPTHVIAQILDAILIAANSGLNIPIVYNSGGYDSAKILQYLDGIIDIYMPDMKYGSDEIGRELSGVDNYAEVNREAVLEMHRQVGDLEMDWQGIAQKGMLIRHLILPDGNAGSEVVLKFIKDHISTDTYLNIMDQYRPTYQANQFETINRRISVGEFQAVVDLAKGMGFKRLD